MTEQDSPTAAAGSGSRISVRLVPMTTAAFENWREHSVESFAQDLARSAGRPLAAARQRARAVFAELLPNGIDTVDTWLRTVVDGEGTQLGTLWLGPHPERPTAAVVYDIEIAAGYRGRGFGRAAMLAAERLALDAGITEIGLNVFGFNTSAQQLYASLGYQVVATQMTKRLVPAVDPPATADVTMGDQPELPKE